MITPRLTLAALVAATCFVSASRASTIVGYLGNFDVYNDTPDATDDFELNLPGVARSDIFGTWNFNAHYGTPTITDLASGAGQFVHYVGKTTDVTPVGGVEHFGASLSSFPTGATYQWSRHGSPVGAPLLFPTPVVTVVPQQPATPEAPETPEHVEIEVRNDSNREMWVEFLEAESAERISLGDLMPDADIVRSATSFDDKRGARRLRPGESLLDDNPSADDILQSQVQVLRVYSANPDRGGTMIGQFMTAAIVSTPEPASLAALGLAVFGASVRRRRATR